MLAVYINNDNPSFIGAGEAVLDILYLMLSKSTDEEIPKIEALREDLADMINIRKDKKKGGDIDG
jgi:hypothetical protein